MDRTLVRAAHYGQTDAPAHFAQVGGQVVETMYRLHSKQFKELRKNDAQNYEKLAVFLHKCRENMQQSPVFFIFKVNLTNKALL